MSVPTIGSLGGVGSGKSSIVRQVTGFQLHIIDADKIGHELLQKPTVLKQLRQSFPTSIFSSSGRVIRSQLARKVFGETADHHSARSQLEQIIHPEILREIKTQIRTVPAGVDAVIVDAAVLLETGWVNECDHLVYIDTPEAQRIERVKSSRNWSAEELERRECTQLPLEEKRQRAEFIVDNSASLEQAVQQLTGILHTLVTL